jgi:hypothetical protein
MGEFFFGPYGHDAISNGYVLINIPQIHSEGELQR